MNFKLRKLLSILFVCCCLSEAALAETAKLPSNCNLAAKAADRAGANCAKAWMDANLRLNEIQFVGTAESYKLRPSAALLSLVRMGAPDEVAALNFSQPPITDQLDAGARSLQFDVAYDPKGGTYKYPAGAIMAMELVSGPFVEAMAKPGFKVVHILDIDFNSSCVKLEVCLQSVASWSRSHPGHLPIIIVIKTNDERTPMPGATRPFKIDAQAFNSLDATILNVFRRTELITPDTVQGSAATLHDAIHLRGWPSLGKLRGKALFLLDDTPQKVALYRGNRRSLEGRIMFVSADPKSPVAGFVTVEDPTKAEPAIESYVKSGLIVHTYSDANAKEAKANNLSRSLTALGSGAQIISTDFIKPDLRISSYQVHLPKGLVARCNVILGLDRCANREVELDSQTPQPRPNH